MFKKLKQKINEEQSPQKNAQSQQQQPPQAQQVGPRDQHGHAPSLPHDDSPSSPSDRESTVRGSKEPASPGGSVNGDGSVSPQKQDSQSLAQKLQLRVPSMESLFRSPGRGDGLFRASSRENLARSSSRESLTRLENETPAAAPAYDPPSDIESEAEDTPGNADTLSKEQLVHRLHRVERSLGNYRGKYSELVTAYRTVQREKEKTQTILSQCQDKALRRISELREELQMDQQAKKHLQEEFDAALEEKDQMITVLQTQVALMKKRLQGVPEDAVPPEGEATQPDGSLEPPSPDASCPNEAEGGSVPPKAIEALQKRVHRQENLLQKCKELLRSQKERSTQLGSENEALQQQLQERLQELEKMKELHTTEKTRLITQLRDAKNLIEQLEQDKGMVIAETKRQMHETLEMKEEEVAQLRARIQQVVSDKDELQEQRERSERAAFEELERALGMAQRAEEARRQLQAKMEEQVKHVERASEEERRSLQQELTRVKQEVVQIMKKSSEERVAELERLHAQALASREQELSSQLQQKESHFQEQLSQAMERCRAELTQAMQERDEQVALALEEAELQKAAVQSEGNGRVQELQQELETARTRILELESSLPTPPQDEVDAPIDNSAKVDQEKMKHEEEMSALEAKHQEALECLREEQAKLAKQHNVELEALREQHQVELESALKEKEAQFHAHVEDMNLKTLEKLDVKQTELETLASELAEVLRSREQLEEQLLESRGVVDAARREFEEELQKERFKYQVEIEGIQSQHEQSLGGVEKTLKEELNKLKMVLEEKEKALEEQLKKEQALKEAVEKALQEGKDKLDELAASHQNEREAQRASALELEGLKHSLEEVQAEKDTLLEASTQLRDVTAELATYKDQMNELEKSLRASDQKAEGLIHKHAAEEQELRQQLEQAKKELETLERQREEDNETKRRFDVEKAAAETTLVNIKREMEGKLKAQESKMEKIKQKAKEMNEKFKKKLQEQEEKFKAELERKERELVKKDEQVKEKILEMSQASSAGLSDMIAQLETTHKDQLERQKDTLKKEQEELSQSWQRRMGQQEEEMQEKYHSKLQEKMQEVSEVTQQLVTCREEREQLMRDIKDLREELVMRETTVQKLQAELKEAATKLESLSQGEVLLKEQVEAVEKNLNQALNERNSFQDQLIKAEENSREKVQTLTKQLDDTQRKMQVLDESEDLKKRLEEGTLKMQAKEEEFTNQMDLMNKRLFQLCREVHMKMEGGSNELCAKVEDRISIIKDRVVYGQKELEHLRHAIHTRSKNTRALEVQLQEKTEEISRLCVSLEQMMSQMNAHTELISTLTTEKESLQRDLQTMSEKDLCIEQLRRDNINLSETHKGCVCSLESAINDLKTQLADSLAGKEIAVSALDQEHKEQHQNLLKQMEETVKILNAEKIAALEEAEQLKKKVEAHFTQNHNALKSLQDKLEDMERQITKKDEQVEKLTSTIDRQSISKSEMDQVLSEKEQRLFAITTELAGCKSRVDELEGQLAVREREQRELQEQLWQSQAQASESKSLEKDTEDRVQALVLECQATRQELAKQKEDFERAKAQILRDKEDTLKAADERLTSEGASKLAELKRKAEQKISQVRKQLTAQLEEKEQALRDFQGQVEEKEQGFKGLEKQLEALKEDMDRREQCIKALEEKVESLEDALAKERAEANQQVEKVRNDEKLEKESSLQSLKEMHEEKLSALEKEVANQKEALQAFEEKDRERLSVQEDADSRLEEVMMKLKQAEGDRLSFQAEVERLKAELIAQAALAGTTADLQEQVLQKERKIEELESSLEELKKSLVDRETAETIVALKAEVVQSCPSKEPMEYQHEQDSLVEEYKQKLQEMSERLRESQTLLKAYEQGATLAAAAVPISDGLSGDPSVQQGEVNEKRGEAENEKQKLRKELARLQKDIRSLRKEQEQELEIVRKEVEEECQKNHKLELEDVELQHNSRLKQLMREFNTHMAQKEQELEAAVREAIGKAQEVEAELIGSHQEEACQLRKTISQKEEDLSRTVHKYEEILESREKEMGARVFEVQKELDELQQRIQSSEENSLTDLQAQLAQKTTLLSEARLKEQEYQEKIHSLEDKLKFVHKNSVVTHLATPYRDAGHYSTDTFSEPTELEYLRKVMFEYMMGRETKTMAKVITSMLKFPPEQTQKVLEKEDSRSLPWLR